MQKENSLPVLDVKNLEASFFLRKGLLKAVDKVSFRVERGESFGLVGESGSGKSVTALSVMRLLPEPPARITGGEINFQGRDLLRLSREEIRKIRGKNISMIFQEPLVSLNPSYTIGEQIAETLRFHQQGCQKKEITEKTVEILELVGITSSQKRLKQYPHHFSGGMRQRVMIAMALACKPALLIADEPTTALDVTIQSQILHLLSELMGKLQMSMIFISHNLGVVAQICDKIGVMYAGNIIEFTDKYSLFTKTLHPYTMGLLKSIPRKGHHREFLEPIRGTVCSLLKPPPGCKFHPRCDHSKNSCRDEMPSLKEAEKGHFVACHLYD